MRSAAPEVAVSETDGTADALDALRAAAPGETDLPDERADALDALRNLPDTAATAPTAEAGTALDALRAAGEAVDAAAAAEEDPLDALRSLDLPEESPGPDGSAVALDSLRDIEVEEPMAADDLDAALDALTAMAETAVESDGAPDEAAAALDALRAVPVETVAAPEDDGAAALDALRDLDMPEAAEADDPLAALRDLERPEGSVELSEAEDPLASLGDTAEPDEVGDELDDLDALLAEREAGPDATDDLAELDALLADSDEPETTADQADGLEDLDSLLDEPAELQADELDGLIGGSAEADADTAEDSTDPGAPFGVITAPKPEREESNEFRIAILGDFSGRASRGELEIGEALGARKAIKFDIDEIDRVIARFQTTLTLPIGADGAAVEVPLASLDDLHPDELYENVAVFDELRALRQRLKTGKGLDATIAEMQQWGAEFGDKPVGARGRGKGAAVPADRRLSDFQRLIGDAGGAQVGPSAADALMQRVVGPHVVAAPDPRQESMIAAVDEALSSAMRAILHHPDFQTVEALWRSLDLLARRVETDAKLRIVLYDVSAEEWAADLSAQEDLAESGLYALLAEGEAPFSAVFGLYTLEETPPHAELLARMAKISAHLEAPFVTAIGAGFLETPLKDRHPLTTKAWEAMRDCPEARYVGLAAPRFLLRLPYGKRTEPIDPFSFEEFTEREGLKGMLWANPAVLVAVLLAATAKGGVRSMSLGKIMSLGDMPFHYVTDRYGDQVALPCTERMITTRKAAEIVARGFMPVVSMQGRPELRLASFQGLGHGELMGPWSGAEPVAAGEAGPDPAVAMDVNAGSDQPDADQDHMLDGSGADDDGLADGGDDDDLDALLAGFGDDDAGIGGDDETDADLAALLEDL
ncbi:MAG: type VI secretion system contractile sheath large subunit [Pseudomonadota bacterium]